MSNKKNGYLAFLFCINEKTHDFTLPGKHESWLRTIDSDVCLMILGDLIKRTLELIFMRFFIIINQKYYSVYYTFFMKFGSREIPEFKKN